MGDNAITLSLCMPLALLASFTIMLFASHSHTVATSPFFEFDGFKLYSSFIFGDVYDVSHECSLVE